MKRFSINKDLIMQNFGRQIRLFEHIKKFGHDVDFLCIDYTKFESKKVRINNIDYYIEPFSLIKFSVFLKKLNLLLSSMRYDIIVASTSPILGIIAYYYSKKYNIKMMYDLQDSFDVYDEYKIPMVKLIDKYVIKNADIVICVSESLSKIVGQFRKKPTFIIQNGYETGLFKPLDKEKARKKLNLPIGAKIIVYIGSLERLKGFDVMLDALSLIRKKYPNAYLLISGKIDKGIDVKQKNVIYRKFPKRQEVVLAINSADVAIIPNLTNKFTKYSFPYKLVEYMACRVPIVATKVGDVTNMLKNYKGSLCNPNDADDLAEKIIDKLKHYERIDYGKELMELDWEILAVKLNKSIAKAYSAQKI